MPLAFLVKYSPSFCLLEALYLYLISNGQFCWGKCSWLAGLLFCFALLFFRTLYHFGISWPASFVLRNPLIFFWNLPCIWKVAFLLLLLKFSLCPLLLRISLQYGSYFPRNTNKS